MFVTIINDCRDDNARSRQESRITSHLACPVSFIGVNSDLEAGMQLVDILDATEGRLGLILVNVAPRGGHTTRWENGTPFAYCRYGETLIISTVDGFALSGLRRFTSIDEVQLLDTHSTAAAMLTAGFINETTAAHIPRTQFRSFDFSPRAGIFLLQGNTLPSEPYTLSNVPDLPPAIWHIDSFGNCKTTLTPDDVETYTDVVTRYGTFPFIEQLRNLPDATTGIIRGSSGFGQTRLLELMIQRGNFAERHQAHIGDDILSEQSHFTRATT